ncbi:MAG: hypothetical protein ACKPKO_60065, partial [Candidatus Fonsibacter sp.]
VPARTRTGNATVTQEHHSGSRVCGVERRDWSLRCVVTRILRIHTVEAEYGALRHVVARLVSHTALIKYIAQRDLYHLPKQQPGIDRMVPNTTHYRSVVNGRHPQPQPLAPVTKLNISNIGHYIC